MPLRVLRTRLLRTNWAVAVHDRMDWEGVDRHSRLLNDHTVREEGDRHSLRHHHHHRTLTARGRMMNRRTTQDHRRSIVEEDRKRGDYLSRVHRHIHLHDHLVRLLDRLVLVHRHRLCGPNPCPTR